MTTPKVFSDSVIVTVTIDVHENKNVALSVILGAYINA